MFQAVFDVLIVSLVVFFFLRFVFGWLKKREAEKKASKKG